MENGKYKKMNKKGKKFEGKGIFFKVKNKKGSN